MHNGLTDSDDRSLESSTNETEDEIIAKQEELCSLDLRLRAVEQDIERMGSSEGLKELVQINLSGSVATIMGLRLGSDPSSPTPLEEINGALGHLCFSLHLLCQTLDFRFSKFVISLLTSLLNSLSLRSKDTSLFPEATDQRSNRSTEMSFIKCESLCHSLLSITRPRS